jgi:luciferase-like monooxygenase
VALGGRPSRWRLRGTGRARKLRRALERGGAGAAARLNEEIGAWAGARIAPMFGRWGYFVGAQLFACFPLHPKEYDLWLRLPVADQARALAVEGFRPHRRFAARGWVEYDVRSPADLRRALPWLRRSFEGTRRVEGT